MSSLQQSAVPPPPYPAPQTISGSLLPLPSAAPSAAQGWIAITIRDPLPPISAPHVSGLGLPPQYISRERKYGEFSRQLPVPARMKAVDIRASLDGGILSLSLALGTPLMEEEINAL
ncbi:hypothetical protein BDP27DRAFT_1422839 [Rhodocollybia butyracea]|uniref:SHSP domain-containing protein n=1 Tax=Rhodocollybia butyracea TaxID=206335 RepID=A0A9P5U715_9AGAR|nr:hypothetical protein BDP27DRAFT_1422839 [Rhodocollybia butyracea]